MINEIEYYKYDEIKNELLDYVENNNLTLFQYCNDIVCRISWVVQGAPKNYIKNSL